MQILADVRGCISLLESTHKSVCVCVFTGGFSGCYPQKYRPELWQGHLWAFQSILSTNPNWSHALLVPNMRWRTGGSWITSLNTRTHTSTHTIHLWHAHPPSPLLSLFSSPLLYALVSGCANPPAESGTRLPIWPSTTPAGRERGPEGWKDERGERVGGEEDWGETGMRLCVMSGDV